MLKLHTQAPPGKGWMWILFCLAVVLKALLLRTYLVVNGDRALQVVATLEMLKGKGYTTPVVGLSDINSVANRVLLEWPPLYSVILAGFMKITGLGLTASLTAIETAGVFIYLYGIWRLTKLLGFSQWIQLMLVWIRAADIYEAMYWSPPTDYLAAGSLIMALVFFLRWLENEKWKMLAGSAVFLAAAFLFRYLYITTLFVLPVLLLWNGWRQARGKYLKAGFLLGTMVAIPVVLYFGYNKAMTGHFTYLEQWGRGFYPRKLLDLVPLFWQSFSHVSFVCMQFAAVFGIDYSIPQNILKLSSVLLLTYMITRWIRREQAWKMILPVNPAQRFFLSAALLQLPYLAILVYLSLRVDTSLDNPFWSYLSEDRYLLFATTLISIVICWYLFRKEWGNRRLQSVFKAIFFLAFFVQVSHAAYITTKRVYMEGWKDPLSSAEDKVVWDVMDNIRHNARLRGNEVVMFSKEYGYSYYAYVRGIKVFRALSKLRESNYFQASRPTTVMLVLNMNAEKVFTPFIHQHGFVLERQIGGICIYLKEIKP